MAAGPLAETAAMLKEAGGLMDSNPTGPTWWHVPAQVAAAGGGLYGGWKLLDMLVKNRQKAEQTDEVGDAKNEYDDAMRQQFQFALAGKNSAFDGLDEIFDRLTEVMEKDAEILPEKMPQAVLHPIRALKNLGHGTAGAYLTALGLVTGAGGLAGYQWAKSRSDKKMTDKAIMLRRHMRQGPMPIYAYPTQMRMPAQSDVAEEEEAR